MGGCGIKLNKNIFAVFVGLIASGYNLSDDEKYNKIIDSIREAKYEEEVIDYFRKAKTLTCEVNPYWPRAFLLTVWSLFLTQEESYEHIDFNKLEDYIENLQQINPMEKSTELYKWLKELELNIDKIKNNVKFQEAWIKYTTQVNENMEEYNSVTNEAFSLVKSILHISEDSMPNLIVIPNYLQAPQSTDFITKEEKIHIIKTEPDKESIIHELLHHIIYEKLDECRDIVNRYSDLLKPVFDDMERYQYAWDYSEDSWNRVFEENFMRAASIWINYNDNLENAREHALLHKNQGFAYVPIILEELFSNWKGLNEFVEFIENSLERCSRDFMTLV